MALISFRKIVNELFRPINIAPLVFFRILGGALITIEIIGELLTDYRKNYTETQFHFSYVLLQSFKPWSPLGVYVHFLFNILMGIFVTIGFYYRVSAVLLFIGTSSLFLMEKSVYINHTYLYCLVSFLLIFIPAHRAYSVDVSMNPSSESSSAPAWTRYVLLFQISIVYFYAGLAKLNVDWLLARPMKVWLGESIDYPLYGWILGTWWMPYLTSYGGVLFDLLIVPAMLWKRVRKYAFVVAICFHLCNVFIFFLGTFPWFSIVMTSLFFDPDSFGNLPTLKNRLPRWPRKDYNKIYTQWKKKLIAFALASYCTLQIVIPLRHWLYEGNTSWTEEGHKFSWRMMLRSKRGAVEYYVYDPYSGQSWREDPYQYLTNFQYSDMIGSPDMILEFAHFLAEKYRKSGYKDVKVHAKTNVSLNGRRSEPMIDETLDLAPLKRSLKHYDWILPWKDD